MFGPSELYFYQKYFYQKKLIRLAKSMARLNIILNGADIGIEAQIGQHFTIHHGVGLVIGNAVKIGDNFTCFQNVTIGTKNLGMVAKGIENRSPTIGNNVTIYPVTVVAGPIHIGDDVVVGAHSIVMQDVPPGSKLPAGTHWL
ncbi:MAG: serine O-acetyltransferase [Chloroflexota bacterium]